MLSVSEALPIHDSPDMNPPDDLYGVAEDLMQRSRAAREQGDIASSQRLLRAALDLMAEDQLPSRAVEPKVSPKTSKVMELLRTGWRDHTELAQEAGISAGSLRMILQHMRRKGVNLEVQTVKRYRIIDKD